MPCSYAGQERGNVVFQAYDELGISVWQRSVRLPRVDLVLTDTVEHVLPHHLNIPFNDIMRPVGHM